MKSFLSAVFLLGLSVHPCRSEPDVSLEAGFANPPEQTKPWCYWYWISDNISKEGITRDLEAMQRVGIGEALIGNIFQPDQPVGGTKVLSEEWWLLVEHAIREGGRIGVNIGMFNCPGWSQSGGPWIQPEQTMRYVASSEVHVTGPVKFADKLAVPKEPFQDIAVLAFPAPLHDGDSLAAGSPHVSCKPALDGVGKLFDGNLETTLRFPPAVRKAPVVMDIRLDAPVTVRSLRIHPGNDAFAADADLQVADADGKFRSLRQFRCDRSNPAIGTGFMPRGPVTVAFPAATGCRFRIVFSGLSGRGNVLSLAEIDLSGAARLESYIEKQLAKMHPTPLPMADTYMWRTQQEPESSALAVPVEGVLDLTKMMSADGRLAWDVPAGEWIVQRIGMTPTGMRNSPASPEGQGLEVDKMNRELTRGHFDAFIGRLLKRMPAAERKAFTRVIADSYEMGSQNWTDDLAVSFRKEYGYDPKPWLPVLSGRIVGSASRSDRFLWDLRRLVADRVATDYVGGLNAIAKENGLGLWLENYGHWGFPGEFLKYGGQSDRIGGEFWVTGDLGSIECRAASSCANTYGKPFVSAESFTGGPAFQNSPGALKMRGDWSFCEGVNHAVLHVYIQQPSDDKLPGINAWFGTEFNRHNTWFEKSRAWVDYERRCCWMLQQGWRMTDVAYFIGEDAPKMTGARNPELPPGRDFDYINAEVIGKGLSVRDGRLVLPHGVGYQVMVLPDQSTMRPELLAVIGDLVKAGATVLGRPPSRSPGLKNHPQCDAEVAGLAAGIWGGTELPPAGERAYGKGRVIWGHKLTEIFAKTGNPPDIEYRNVAKDANLLFTHRTSPAAEIYFVTNQKDRTERADCVFRTAGRQPELWNAVTGGRRMLPVWREEAGRTILPLVFGPKQSWFVVFRQPGSPASGNAVNFPQATPLLALEGGWDVAFDPKRGGPAAVVFPELSDWTRHPEDGIRHYSGTAVYQKSFSLPDKPAARMLLDLGEVRDMATVTVNGRELGTLWTPPWQVDVTDAVKQGGNVLKIEVINPWNNRLVGDLKLPAAKRLTSLSLNTIKPGTPLLPAGLLGPVTIHTTPATP